MAETLTNLRTRAQGYANAENDNNIATSVWTSWVNAGYKALWRLLARQHTDHFLEGPTSFVLSGSNDTYTLSTLSPTFWKLRAIDYQNGSDWERVRRFNFEERNRIKRAYRVMGTKIRIIPQGNAAGTYRVWYIGEPTALSADGDEIAAALNMYDEYIVLFAAVRARKRQRKEHADLYSDLAVLIADIRSNAQDRDEGSPDTVIDVEGTSWVDELPGPT